MGIGYFQPRRFSIFGPQPNYDMHALEHPADRLEDRLIDFAVRIIAITGKLPATPASDHISRQLLRAGTSPAPNYGEARAAESRADFVHKLKIALKELNETSVWLKMAVRAKLAANESVEPTIDECRQLSRILGSSIHTARRNARASGT